MFNLSRVWSIVSRFVLFVGVMGQVAFTHGAQQFDAEKEWEAIKSQLTRAPL